MITETTGFGDYDLKNTLGLAIMITEPTGFGD